MASSRARAWGTSIAVGLICLIAVFPLYWMITMAFKPQAEWTPVGEIHWAPQDPTLENFKQIFGKSDTFSYAAATEAIKTSVIASLGGTALAMVAGVLAAYGIARFRGGGRLLPFQILQLRMLPPVAVLIPTLILWSNIGLIDTYLGLILLYGVVTMPFAVWFMRGFFLDVPRETAEAAIVEGSSHWGAFVRIVLPQVRGGLAVTTLFVFILNWSDFLLALVLSRTEVITAPVFLNSLQFAGAGQLYGPQAALGLLLIIPPAVFGLMIQRYLVQGVTLGAVRG
jgi:multiple sugar transport system permease protein